MHIAQPSQAAADRPPAHRGHRRARAHLHLRDHRHLAGRLQQQRQRQPGHRQRQGRRIHAHRPELPAGEASRRTAACRSPSTRSTSRAGSRTRPTPNTAALQPCNAANSAGSNLGPSNPLLKETTKAAVAAYVAAGVSAPVPIDLVTSDFTGFDPDISEAAALAQVNMVASCPRTRPPPRSGRWWNPSCRAGSCGCSASPWSTSSNSTSRLTPSSRASPR